MMNLLMAIQQLFNFTDFITGLVFFIMGFIILLQYQQYKHLSDLKIVEKIWILALFGLFQGLGQWGAALMPISLAPHVPPYLSFLFSLWQVFFSTVSYCCLYWFAIEVMSLALKKNNFLKFSVLVLIAVWLFIFFFTHSYNWVIWLNTSLIWSRFLLAFPGSILAALALSLEAKEFRSVEMPAIVNNLYGAIVSFCLYALSFGINPPNVPLLTIFSGAWHVTLADVLRTTGGLGMGVFLIRVMEIFSIENNKKLAAAQHREVVLQERLRIGRDLHDGVIQSLYAIGLSLEVVNNTLDTSLPKSKQILNSVMDNLDATIREIRHYILDLSLPEGQGPKWPENVRALVEAFAHTGLDIQLSYRVAGNALNIDPHTAQELQYVIREALSNAARHAQATQIQVNISKKGDNLEIAVVDNGVGFEIEKSGDDLLTGKGLRNMQKRVENLGGEFAIAGKIAQGTEVLIKLPLE
jgi:signal transduction histidine kinase